MGLGIAASLPWKDIILALPGVASTANDLLKKWKSKPEQDPLDENESPAQQIAVIAERLQALESAQAAQAALNKELADQLQALSVGLTEVSRRVTMALWIAGVGAGTAAAALIVVLSR
jgi:DNA-directed RNA polymerase specialized sigma24 family protein